MTKKIQTMWIKLGIILYMEYVVGTEITFKKKEPEPKEKSLLVVSYLPGTQYSNFSDMVGRFLNMSTPQNTATA